MPALNPLTVAPDNIEGFEQDKPTLIAEDLERLFGVPREATYRILLARGVFKWLAVRRQLISLKKAKHVSPADIRELCKSPRWQAPAFDGAAAKWLQSVSPQKRTVSIKLRTKLRNAKRDRPCPP